MRRSIVLLFLCATGCVASSIVGTVDTLARNFDEIQTTSDVKESFLFAASEIFFPGGVTEDPRMLPALNESQLKAVDAFLQARVQGIYEVSNDLVRTHPQFARPGAPAAAFRRVKFTTTGQPEAVVDSEGTVFLDVRVLQAVFRTVVADWVISLEEDRRKPIGEAAAIQSFNGFAKTVREVPASMDLSLLKHMIFPKERAPSARPSSLGGFADRTFEAMDSTFADLRTRALARAAQERFESSIDFIFAHELAHRAFGHLEQRSGPAYAALTDEQKCDLLRRQELAADEFAALIVVAGQFRSSRSHIIRAGNNIEPTGYIRDIYGYKSLFSRGMLIAGFDDRLGFQGCTYPPPSARMNTVHGFARFSRDVLDVALLQEGSLRGQWLASRDDARLPLILQTGGTRYVSGEKDFGMALMESLLEMWTPTLRIDEGDVRLPDRAGKAVQVERFRPLVSPLLEQRFNGRV